MINQFKHAVIYEDEKITASTVGEYFKDLDLEPRLFDVLKELLKFAREAISALFIIDINMGSGRPREGLEAIRALQQIRIEQSRRFYIAALTSGPEHAQAAAAAGADCFFEKSPDMRHDTLEIAARAVAHLETENRDQGQEITRRLILESFKVIESHLGGALASGRPMLHLRQADTAARSALRRPFLLDNDARILAVITNSLSEMLQADEMSRELVNQLQEMSRLGQSEDQHRRGLATSLGKLTSIHREGTLRPLSDEDFAEIGEDREND
jgi:DNA-binding NarL/FixJ family response regulator